MPCRIRQIDSADFVVINQNPHLAVAIDREGRLPERNYCAGRGADGDGAREAADGIAGIIVRFVGIDEGDFVSALDGSVFNLDTKLPISVMGFSGGEGLRCHVNISVMFGGRCDQNGE